ncbi:Pollen allergen ole e 6 [Macleaya cordata]|uniref:Pollen allergen ole e 6 n=1 Tax=Macleaya cordata TaxID=56857 RepID=A0A200QYN7_MACCD|nr:Pollen allergen ole e 6 [Macleaya cordata]
MAKKIVAMFVMCIVLVATLYVQETAAIDENMKAYAEFKSCFNTCKPECIAEGKGNSMCEIKCDSECAAKEVAGN